MAITENIFTADEIKAAITSNPSLVAIIKEGIGDTAHIYTPDELNTFLSGERQKVIDATTSDIYNNIDKDLLELTGEKKGNEKTYDYMKRVVGVVLNDKKGLQNKIATLEDEYKKGVNEIALQQLEAAKTQLEGITGKYNTLLTEVETEKKKNSIMLAMQGLKFNPAFPKEVIDTMSSTVIDDLVRNSKIENGATIFLGADGKAILNGIQIADASYLLQQRLASILDKQKTVGGGGSDPSVPHGGGGLATKIKGADGQMVDVPSDIPKSKDAYLEYFLKAGADRKTKEFNDEFEKITKDFPIIIR